jgi:hypothetical protein
VEQAGTVSELASRILASGRISGVDGSPEDQDAIDGEMIQQYHAIAEPWRKKIAELSKSNRRLCAVFATLAVNDRETATNILQSRSPGNDALANSPASDPILREMLVLVNKVARRSAGPIYNNTVMATVCAFVTSFIFLYAFRVVTDYRFPPEALPAAQPAKAGAFEFALYTSLTLLFTFLSAGLAALFFRNVKLLSGKYVRFENLLQFQILQYRWTGIAIVLSALVPYMIATIVYAVRMGDIKNLIDLDKFGSLSFILFCFAWSLVPTTFAIGLCSTVDVLSPQQSTFKLFKVSAGFSLVVRFVAVLVLKTFTLADARYGEIFWSGLCSVTVFSLAVLFMVSFGGRQYMRKDAEPAVLAPSGA